MKNYSIPVLMAPVLVALLNSNALAQTGRDYINMVGSSTVYPFATAVAEKFGQQTGIKTPKVESTGTGGGFKLFCAGVGAQHPDFINASRRMKESELAHCQKNGVNRVVEIKIGYDGIVIANTKSAVAFNLTREDLFKALVKQLPDAQGKLVANPHKTWRDVNAQLPAQKIEVLGPPTTSGTRDAFVELVMEAGCNALPELVALKEKDAPAFKQACHSMRDDGAFIEAGENDNLIVQKLVANSNALGIFGYSFLEENGDKVQGATIDGVAPEFEAIASSQYPISRPLYVYAKQEHIGVIPGMVEFIDTLTAHQTWSEEGFLVDKGLIPMTDKEQTYFRKSALDLLPLSLP